MFKHMLPNIISPTIVSTTMGIGGAIIGDDLLNRYQAFTCPRNEKGEPDRTSPIMMVSMRTLVGAGILGAGLLASTIYDATHPRPYVAPAPVVVQQPQVVVQQPQVVVQQPAPVVVQQQPVGHYETRVQNVWVEGRYIDQTTPQGSVVRTWQPGHYEQQQTQVWVP